MKKLVMLILALLMVIALAACNPDSGNTVIHPEAVMLEKEAITLQVGQEETLVAVVDMNATDRSVSWSSSDAAVATVDSSGKVTAVAEGNAVITVKTNDGGKTAQCSVTVKPADAKTLLEVKGINAVGEVSSTDTLIFREDGTYSVYAMFLGAVEVQYESTYEVKDGVLTVPNPGPNVNTSFGEFPTFPNVEVYGDTVRFTILSDNGSQITLGSYILSAEDAAALGVTVGEPIQEVKVTGVTLTQPSVDLLSGAKLDMSAIVKVEPENATNQKYTVTIDAASNSGRNLAEDNGVIGLNAGTAKVIITTEDGAFTAECMVNVTYPERGDLVNEANYFAEKVAMSGKLDLSAFGGTVKDVVYIYNPDGTLEAYVDYVLSQRGYYSLVGAEGNFTEMKMQRFFDGDATVAITQDAGKLSMDVGVPGLPILLTQCDMDTAGHFEADVSFEGTLDLSAIIPGFVQQKVFTCCADGTVKTSTDGTADPTTGSYNLIVINGKAVTIVLDMGADGIFTCALNETDGVRSFTIDALAMTMTEQKA